MTLPAQDIVERLREADANSQQRALGSRIFGEAADLISRLTADNETLRTQVERQTAAGYCDAQWLSDGPPFKCGWQHRADAAEARADALAQALQTIVETLDAEEMGEGPSASEWTAHWQKLHDDARAALGDRP